MTKGREIFGARKDGTIFAMGVSIGEAEINGKRYFTGIVRDISERKLAEDRLREQTTVLRNVLDSVGQGVVILGHDRKLLAWNENYESIQRFSEGFLRIGLSRRMLPDWASMAKETSKSWSKSG